MKKIVLPNQLFIEKGRVLKQKPSFSVQNTVFQCKTLFISAKHCVSVNSTVYQQSHMFFWQI